MSEQMTLTGECSCGVRTTAGGKQCAESLNVDGRDRTVIRRVEARGVEDGTLSRKSDNKQQRKRKQGKAILCTAWARSTTRCRSCGIRRNSCRPSLGCCRRSLQTGSPQRRQAMKLLHTQRHHTSNNSSTAKPPSKSDIRNINLLCNNAPQMTSEGRVTECSPGEETLET